MGKAFCDKELSETRAKKAEHETTIKKLSNKIDQAAARSAKLKEEIAELQKGLQKLKVSQLEMDKMRQEEKATFTASEAETSKGLDGIKLALKMLPDSKKATILLSYIVGLFLQVSWFKKMVAGVMKLLKKNKRTAVEKSTDAELGSCEGVPQLLIS